MNKPTPIGSGTKEDPDSYIVDLALVAAVERGEWNIVMLQALCSFAREVLAERDLATIRGRHGKGARR